MQVLDSNAKRQDHKWFIQNKLDNESAAIFFIARSFSLITWIPFYNYICYATSPDDPSIPESCVALGSKQTYGISHRHGFDVFAHQFQNKKSNRLGQKNLN